ncbi:MAG: glycosyltransferase family 39 protein, partial [Lachnospiraceae bacterium]|nr:glycosyltransferase family 39 protein [Lachnospiraceae bacterium]
MKNRVSDYIRANWRTIIEYSLVIASGWIFLLLASSWTSPLYPYSYGYDASWYSLGGRAIVEGRVPFRDFFDLKGPVLFFYEALGQFFIRGRGGVFLIQCLSMAFTVGFFWRSERIYLKRWQSAIILALFYYVYTPLLWGGNSAEELFMPFNMIAIFYGLTFIEKGDDDSFPVEKVSLIFGIGFALAALSKVTIAAALISVMVTVVILLLYRREFGRLGKAALYFVLGAFFVTLPVFAYFAMNGALEDFIFCSFIFALKRSTDYYESFSVEWELNLVICWAGIIVGLLLPRKGKRRGGGAYKLLLVLMSLILYGLLHLGTPYLYYFIS